MFQKNKKLKEEDHEMIDCLVMIMNDLKIFLIKLVHKKNFLASIAYEFEIISYGI